MFTKVLGSREEKGRQLLQQEVTNPSVPPLIAI